MIFAQARQAIIDQGISEDVATDITNMETSLKSGIMNYEIRTKENSSKTTAESFTKEAFAPFYNALYILDIKKSLKWKRK